MGKRRSYLSLLCDLTFGECMGWLDDPSGAITLSENKGKNKCAMQLGQRKTAAYDTLAALPVGFLPRM